MVRLRWAPTVDFAINWHKNSITRPSEVKLCGGWKGEQAGRRVSKTTRPPSAGLAWIEVCLWRDRGFSMGSESVRLETIPGANRWLAGKKD